MLWQSFYFIWSILCLLTLDLVHGSSVLVCKPGEKVSGSRTRCEPCPSNQYNPKSSQSPECRNCDPCGMYSEKISDCTPTSNTQCRCLKGFTAWDSTNKRCRCDRGSGIKVLGNEQICEKCPHKTFSDKVNSKCQPNLQFQSTEKIPGNATSDDNYGNEATTVVPYSSPLLLSHTAISTSVMTPTISRNSISTPTTSSPESKDSINYHIWLTSLAVLLLLILILKLRRCPKKKTEIVRQGSACGKPVEESEMGLCPVMTHKLLMYQTWITCGLRTN
ncbi:tumor necrosis factor receptor superfamily member 10C isoform X2 [Neoarius graeffei]|nr:tumor necrosis factor receptor superfamily member 10C isoform X2 [Neoarius graeffei]